MPPAVICLAHDRALGTNAHMHTFKGMPDRNVRDLVRQSDGQANMHPEYGMPEGWKPAIGGRRGPALPIGGIEFIGLADVVTRGARQKDIPVDSGLRIGLLELEPD